MGHLPEWQSLEPPAEVDESEYEDWFEMRFDEEMRGIWSRIEDDAALRYACGQAEKTEDGSLHFQIYTEWKRSFRRNEVVARIPSHAEPVRGTRTQARDYCRKSETRVYALPELGRWRPERGADGWGHATSPKARALAYIEEGMTPREIAVADPQCFFTHHRAIKALYEALQGAECAPVVRKFDEEE